MARTREAPVGSLAATVVASNVAPYQVVSDATIGMRHSSTSVPTAGRVIFEEDAVLPPTADDDAILLGERRPSTCTFVAVQIQKRVASMFHLTPHPETAPKIDGGGIPLADALIDARRGKSFFDLVAPLYERSFEEEDVATVDSGKTTVHEKK